MATIDQSKAKKPGTINGDTDSNVNDTITGSNFNDTINAGAGNDKVAGGNGDDIVNGGTGNDILWGDSFNNSNSNDNGQDKLYGGDGNDQVHGGNGKDLVDGGAGNDCLYGENGVDTLFGDTGRDDLYGGNAGDSFVYVKTSDSTAAVSPAGTWSSTTGDWIHDFNGGEGDKLDFTNFPASELTGAGGNDLTWSDSAGAHKIWSDGQYVYADTNGDTTADLVIKVDGVGVGNIIGINHAPTDDDDTNNVEEDVTVTADGNLLDNANDPDAGDDLDVTVTGSVVDGSESGFDVRVDGTYGSLFVNTETGAYHYELDHDLANSLQAGEEQDETFTYEVSDGHGGTNSSTLTITVTGTNDAPELDGDLAATVQEGSSVVITTADLNFTDVDDGAADVTFTVTDLSHGIIKVDGTTQNTFTGADLAAGKVEFFHDGSEGPDAGFNVSVEDGDEDVSTPTAQAFAITVTPVDEGDAAVTISGTPEVGETLTALFDDLDPDGPAQGTPTYQWQADGADIDGATGSTYVLTGDEVGKEITVVVHYTDGQGFAEIITSEATDEVTSDEVDLPDPILPTVTGDPNDHDPDSATATTTNWSASTGGDDIKVGTSSGETINGGNGNDTIYGGAGNDTLNGNNDNDTIYGQPGNDNIDGGGGTGGDTIYGGSGNDTIIGQGGNDTIFGGSGIDTINGGDGTDSITGGYSADNLTGGTGGDSFKYLSANDTGDVIFDFSTAAPTDKLDFSGMDADTTNGVGTDDPFAGLSDTSLAAHSLFYFNDGTDTTVWADTDGNTSTVELEITLKDFTGALTAGVNVLL